MHMQKYNYPHLYKYIVTSRKCIDKLFMSVLMHAHAHRELPKTIIFIHTIIIIYTFNSIIQIQLHIQTSSYNYLSTHTFSKRFIF